MLKSGLVSILSMEVYGKPLIYLDNAASAQKPLQVMNAMNEAMTSGYANVHRGLTIFRIATDDFSGT